MMRGLWWSSVLLSGLIGGIAGAALIFGIWQAFGSGSSSGQTSAPRAGVRVSDSRTQDAVLARNGVDAAAIYARARPSVVTVNTTTVRRRRRDNGEGTGIVLDTGGHILTNNHVVDGASQIQVVLSDGHTYDATVLAIDAENDLAVIGIDAPVGSLTAATLGDSTSLHVGDPVVAIGNPLGYEATLTEGIISGLDRTFQDGSVPPGSHLIQADAAINPGNSGGPLLNARGEVIGVNALLDNADGSNSFSGIGFAVPINIAQTVIAQAAQKKK